MATSNGALYEYIDNQSAQNLSKVLNDQRKLKKFCDFSVITEDGGDIPVHKIVLMSGNLFYTKLFECGFNDSKKECHLLQGVSKEYAEKLVNYIYTGHIEFSSLKEVRDILDKAVFLQMPNLAKFCCEILINSINNENCFDLWKCARSFGELIENSLRLKCMNHIFKNIKDVSDQDQLKNMTIEEIEELLCYESNDIDNVDEKYLFIIIKWFLSNLTEREEYIHRVLNKIHLGNISRQFFKTIILEHEELKKSHNFFQIFFDFFKLHESDFMPTHEKENTKQNTLTELSAECFLIFGGNILQYYHEQKKCSTDFIKIPGEPRNYSASAKFDERNIFVCGGFKKLYLICNDCKYYSIEKNKWNDLPPMLFKRWHHRAVNFDNKIYACGGAETRTVEYFDLNSMKWLQAPDMTNNRAEFGLTTLNNSLFAIDNLNYYEWLDTRENAWMKYKMKDCAETKTQIYRALKRDDNTVYCFGEKHIFTLDVRNKKWISEPRKYGFSHYNNRRSPNVCLYEGNILCALTQTYLKEYFVMKYFLNTETISSSDLSQISSDYIPFEGNFYDYECEEIISITK